MFRLSFAFIEKIDSIKMNGTPLAGLKFFNLRTFDTFTIHAKRATFDDDPFDVS